MSVCTGVSGMLADMLFSEMQQQRLPVQVRSVYMTAFQIVDETIKDLLHTQQPGDHTKQRSSQGQHTHLLCIDLFTLLDNLSVMLQDVLPAIRQCTWRGVLLGHVLVLISVVVPLVSRQCCAL